MFNKELKLEIEELKSKLADRESEIEFLRKKEKILEEKLDAARLTEESMPEGCIKGPWCKACEFSRPFYIRLAEPGNYNVYRYTTIFACNRGNACKNFMQKEEYKNAEN